MTNDRALSATQVLRNSGKTIRGLIDQALASPARAPEMRAGVHRELRMMIEIHSKLEEEHFYPALEDGLETASLAAAGRDNLARLRRVNDLPELAELFALHAKTEEDELFKRAERSGVDLSSLGQRMLERRDELLADPKYRAALPENVQDPHGGEQKRKRSAA